jgi:glycosidase
MTRPFYAFLIAMWLWSCGAPPAIESSQDLRSDRSNPAEWTKSSVVYEVNLRQHTEAGTIRAFMEDMPRIASMGVDVLWFMPVHPIGIENRKGGLGSYYSVADYRGINPEFGTMDDFKAMLAKAHSLGMKVIIDLVANHTAWDHPWVQSNPDFYTRDSLGNMIPPIGTDWSDVTQLNYDNPAMREAMLADMLYWIEEVGIDGFRCDVADWVPLDFWQTAREQMDKIKPVLMLAESENPDHHLRAFDMTYAWELFHLMTEIAAGHRTVLALDSMYIRNASRFGLEDYKLNFITNHDENTWKDTPEELFGEGQKAFAVLTFTLPGTGLIYSGQEANNTKRLEFFEKDAINWGNYSHQDFYTSLISLKRANPALNNGAFGSAMQRINTGADEQVFAFSRILGSNEVYVFLNLSPEVATISIPSEVEGVKEYFTGENHSGSTLCLQAWAYKVFTR